MLMYAEWLVWVIPVLGAVLIAAVGWVHESLPKYLAIATGAITSVFAVSMIPDMIALSSLGETYLHFQVPWAMTPDITLYVGILLDPLSVFMANIAILIGLVIIVYSASYMADHESQARYFALVLLFVGSMTGLVLADNFLQLFIFWEVVGVCSYALIGFYYEKPEAAKAGMKAFIVTRVGDVLLLIGALYAFAQVGSFNYLLIQDAIETGLIGLSALSMISLFTFGGAVGKSAQVPLHVWLPDAMEGPTPVSALIHAATMVKAGIYLVGRTFTLFGSVTLWLNSVIWIGAITSLMAATIALVSKDLKGVLAYSTISQLGLIMTALGIGTTMGWYAGQAHVLSHALFKALLFLCAGSVLHAAHTLDITEMGGLRKKMPITFAASLIGILALSGVPPLNGFWSKDLIFAAAYHEGYMIPLILIWAASVFTVAYSLRWVFMVFLGKARNQEVFDHVHESPKMMTIPLAILAGAVLVTSIFVPLNILPEYFSLHLHFEIELIPLLFSLSALTFGSIPAILVYHYQRTSFSSLSKNRFVRSIQNVLNKGYYFDALYDYIFVRGTLRVFRALFNRLELGLDRSHYVFGPKVESGSKKLHQGAEAGGFDAGNEKFARAMVKVSNGSRFVDTNVIDGAVNGIASSGKSASESLRKAQTGITGNYIAAFAFGIFLLLVFILYIGW